MGYMKKLAAVFFTSVVLITLTACGEEKSGNSGDSYISDTVVGTNDTASAGIGGISADNSDSSDNAGDDFNGSSPSAETPMVDMDIVEAYPEDELTLPDGSTVSKYEAVKTYGSTELPILEFEFGFVRYSQPIFQSSLDSEFDAEEMQFKEPVDSKLSEIKYVMVKPGDTLENGLTVRSAKLLFSWEGASMIKSCKIEYDGEVTFEGILFKMDEDEYITAKDDLLFMPDPTKSEYVPKRYEEYEHIFTYSLNNTAISSDADSINFGNIGNYSLDFSDAFGENSCVKAKVTFGNLLMSKREAGSFSSGTLIDFEIVGD